MTEVPLTQGKVAIIDDRDARRVLRFKWYAARAGCGLFYAVRTHGHKGPLVKMHRFILNADADMEVDHINLNGLDNRRSNLRLATSGQNNCNRARPRNNTTGFKGVSWRKGRKEWYARIRHYGVLRFIGSFTTAVEAARAYDAAARLLHGDFARLNFPGEAQQIAPQTVARLDVWLEELREKRLASSPRSPEQG